MKFWLSLALGLMISFSVSANQTLNELLAKDYPPLKRPKIEVGKLQSGATLYYVQDEVLPILELTILFPGGNYYDAYEKRGMAALTTASWGDGGTKSLDPKTFRRKLMEQGAHVSITAGNNFFEASLSTITDRMSQVMPLFFEIIREPGFDKDRFENLKSRMINGFNFINEKPNNIAWREFGQVLYGEQHPYVVLPTPELLQGYTLEDVKAYYQETAVPGRMLIAAKGPQSFAEMKATLEQGFSGWLADAPLKPKRDLSVKKEWQASRDWIQKEGATAAIVVGHFGDTRHNPDKFKIMVANQMLGGGAFGTRLGDRIRSELGLAYGINSDFGFDESLGQFRISTLVKTENAYQTIKEIQSVFKTFVEEQNITEEEFKGTRQKILNQFVFQFEDPFTVVRNKLIYDQYGYADDYLDRYYEAMQTMTLADMKAILKTYFFPDRLKILVVGDRRRVLQKNWLSRFRRRPLDTE